MYEHPTACNASRGCSLIPGRTRPLVEKIQCLSAESVLRRRRERVFPAEACETIGGEACDVTKIYPEAKLTSSTDSAKPSTATEEYEREYLDYNQQKTVFLGEACDDLGGEFCAAEYQTGVCSDTSLMA